MTLAALQRDFRDWLIDVPVAMDNWVDASARPGLDVYHNAYRVQLVECLKDTFEKTFLWLGEDAFTEAALNYVERTPPSGWTLGVYGKEFDGMLGELYADDPEVAELAWLDWTLSRAFAGADAAPMPTDGLADVDWDRAKLTLAPTIDVGPARTNAGAIWSALSVQDDPPTAALLRSPAAMLVWREDFTPCFRLIDLIEQRALRLIGTGISFGALCGELVKELGQEPGIMKAGAMLAEWISNGLIVAIELQGERI